MRRWLVRYLGCAGLEVGSPGGTGTPSRYKNTNVQGEVRRPSAWYNCSNCCCCCQLRTEYYDECSCTRGMRLPRKSLRHPGALCHAPARSAKLLPMKDAPEIECISRQWAFALLSLGWWYPPLQENLTESTVSITATAPALVLAQRCYRKCIMATKRRESALATALGMLVKQSTTRADSPSCRSDSRPLSKH